ncbi:MAG: hemerythrin domain-containing protein, partial [Pseudomonadota bacterium]
AVLDRLSAEHEEDEALLPEVLETLQALADDTGPEREPDIAGYVLRGYFESQRRHIAWEEDVVMPLARTRLGADDLAALDTVMRSNRAQHPAPAD